MHFQGFPQRKNPDRDREWKRRGAGEFAGGGRGAALAGIFLIF